MSPREKKLLIFFGLGGFAILNLLGFKYFMTTKLDITSKNTRAHSQLQTAEVISANREELAPQIEWLAANERPPTDYQPVQTALQELAEKEVTSTGLTLKSQKLLATDTTGPNFHCVKVQLTVTGPEASLYRWFDRLNDPEKFRRVTYVRLSPNKDDDTMIDCVAIVAQWFVPAPTA